MPDVPTVYRFDAFELQPAARQLLRDGVPVKVGSRALDLLTALVERRDRVVPKGELLDVVWPRLVVEENNLQVHVMALRRLLGPQAITTVPGRGYRFTAALHAAPAAEGPDGPDARDAAGTPARPPATGPVTAPETPLFGREADLELLCARVTSQPLVTLLGAGGVGKSTLAARAVSRCAAGFDDGCAWVDLGLQQPGVPGGVAQAVAAATRVSPGPGALHDALARTLAGARMLLVLDNAEHLVDDVTRIVQALRAAAPGVHLLVTSQVPLKLRAEQQLRLEPLPAPAPGADVAQALRSPAVQLFVDRVRARDRHFVVDPHNVAAVAGLTRRLDGLPLALEMAAARVPGLTPAQIDHALDQRFRLLTQGDPAAPSRQHTLLAALQWTHGLLTPTEQAVFRRLAVLAGPFSLAAAQQVCSDDAVDAWQVLDALVVLVDRSLVTPPVDDPPRYRLLDTPQAFARQQLAAAGEEAASRNRHLQAMVGRLSALFEAHLSATEDAEALRAQGRADADNGLAALAWALAHDPAQAVALAPGLSQALAHRHAERLRVWRRTEPHVDAHPSAAVQARWRLGWANFWNATGHTGHREAAQAAAAVFRQEGHRAGEYRALAIVATVLSGQALTPGHEQALARMQALEDPAWPGDLRYLRQHARITHLDVQDRHDEAVALGNACLDLLADRGGRTLHAMTMMYLELMAGRPRDAARRGEAALDRAPRRQPGAPATGVEILLLLAWLQSGQVQPARALGPAVWTAASAFRYLGPTAEILSLLAVQEGRHRTAALLLGHAEAAYAPQPVQRLRAYRRAGDQARALAREALGDDELAAWTDRGRTLAEASLAALAFATRDAGGIDGPPQALSA